MLSCGCFVFFFFKQKTAYEMRISDWSSDVCSSDLHFAMALIERLAVIRVHAQPYFRASAAAHLREPVRIRERLSREADDVGLARDQHGLRLLEVEIGRASCRERVCQ